MSKSCAWVIVSTLGAWRGGRYRSTVNVTEVAHGRLRLLLHLNCLVSSVARRWAIEFSHRWCAALIAAALLPGCTSPTDQVASSPTADVRESISSTPGEEDRTLRLAVVDAGLSRGCQEAADALGFAVPCPTRVPGTSGDVECKTPGAFSGAEVTPKFGCVLGEGFILEPRIRSSEAGATISHFVIEAAPGGRLCTRESATALTVRDAAVYLAQCDQEGGLHSEHVAAVWELEGIQYIVSAHDWTAYNQRAVLETVRHIELLDPRPRPDLGPVSAGLEVPSDR